MTSRKSYSVIHFFSPVLPSHFFPLRGGLLQFDVLEDSTGLSRIIESRGDCQSSIDTPDRRRSWVAVDGFLVMLPFSSSALQ